MKYNIMSKHSSWASGLYLLGPHLSVTVCQVGGVGQPLDHIKLVLRNA